MIRNLVWKIKSSTDFGMEFQWEKINKNVDFLSDFFKSGWKPLFFQFLLRMAYRTETKSVPVRIFTYRNPYDGPYRVRLRTKFRTKYRTRKSYRKSVPRTKIRTGTDFRYGTAVHGNTDLTYYLLKIIPVFMKKLAWNFKTFSFKTKLPFLWKNAKIMIRMNSRILTNTPLIWFLKFFW